MRRVMWKILLVLVVALALTLRCTSSKKTKSKLLKNLSHIGHQKVSQQRAQKGHKKNSVQPPNEQATIMANPERLDSTEREELNQLQNFNKQYLNNEMAAETAVLADQGIDDDSALRISNMAALPSAPMNPPNAGAHAAIKAKISSGFHQGNSGVLNQASSMAYDPNAYLYDEKSWPEYRIHDSDYSNYRTFEMNNLVNGDNSDMMFGGQNAHPNFRDMPGDEGMEFQGPRPPQYGSFQGGKPSELMKSESKPNIATFKAGQAEGFPIGNKEKQKLSDGSATGGADKPQSTVNTLTAGTAQGQVPVASKSESNAPEAPQDASQKQQQKEQSSTAAAPPPPPKQQQPQQQEQIQTQQQPQQQQQQQQIQTQQSQQQQQQQQQKEPQQQQKQQDKANSVKLATSVVQAAASMPPKAIASLVNSLVVGKGDAGAATPGQIQNKIAGSVSKSMPQDINQAAREVTQLQKVSKAKKH